MCGIAGILNRQPADHGTALQAMQAALRHRGPDDRGRWSSNCGRVQFAHTRLAILDLSPGGHQPMVCVESGLCIVFNGEIFNFRELRAELEQNGAIFRTHSDTEVLLRLYEKEGAAMLPKLRGMYAFAIWSQKEQSCFMARDPFGIKPLYYTVTRDSLFFASEMKALQASGQVSRKLDLVALTAYFQSGSVAEPATLLAEVRCLEAGHSLTWQDGGITTCSHWRVDFGPSASSRQSMTEDHVQSTRDALLDSVRAHFVSDVPVGVFLSGGIDSTALVALSRLTGEQDLRTFSIALDDEMLDESSAAARTAAHFGTQHHELRLDAAQGRRMFGAFLESFDQPTIDGLNTFTVSSFAREQGMKVVLSGLGGDELFAGYPSFKKVPQIVRLARMLGPVRGVAGGLLKRFSNRVPFQRLGAYFEKQPTLRGAYGAFRGVFPQAQARRMAAFAAGVSETDLPCASEHEADSAQPTLADQVSELELTLYMRNQLLKDSDVMSMAHALELRVPFVDRRLFDTLARVPAAVRLQQGKKLLLAAVPEIPDWVSSQPKRGFLFPFQRWLETPEWRDDFAQATHNTPVPLLSWYQKWSLFMLKRWLSR